MSLVGYSPWGCNELGMTEWLTLTFHTFKYSQPFVSTGHASMDSTTLRVENTWNIPESSTKQKLNLPCAATIYVAFALYLQIFALYLQIFTQCFPVLAIISNL